MERTTTLVLAAVLGATGAHAANPEAGRAKAEAVCAACHGANGISVADTIPNLAGQRGAYLESQLKALREGTRKNAVMNAVAAQLAADEIADLAAYFASLPGTPSPTGGTAAKSTFLPALARTRVTFPEDFRRSFVHYHTINFPATRQVRLY